MAFGGLEQGDETPLLSEINTTPLVDVMLVLLVVFMITTPLFTHAVKVDLPQVSARPAETKPDTVRLGISAAGDLYWNDQLVGDEELARRLVTAATIVPQPEVHLRADRTTRYERLAEIMAAVRNAGIHRLGFITSPEKK